MSKVPEFLELARQYHLAGRLHEAEALNHQILVLEPDQPDALNRLGMVAFQAGQHEAAASWIARAIAARPCDAAFYNNMGEAHRALRRFPLAVASFQQAVQLRPDYAAAHENLGHAFFELGRMGDAAESYRRALQWRPDHVEVYQALGVALARQGKSDEAAACFRQILQLAPEHFGAHVQLAQIASERGELARAAELYRRALQHNAQATSIREAPIHGPPKPHRRNEAMEALKQWIALTPSDPVARHLYGALTGFQAADQWNARGNEARWRNQWDEAADCFRKAIECDASHSQAHNNLAGILAILGHTSEAIASYRQALSISPQYAAAHGNLAALLHEAGNLDEAEAHARRAIELDPPDLAAYLNHLAGIVRSQGRLEEAAELYAKAIDLQPNDTSQHAESHFGLGEVALLRGDFDRGWLEYEWRLQSKALCAWAQRFSQPRWDGKSLRGRTVLIYPEQGFGDMIFFLRYLPLAEASGGRVVAECPPELLRLLQQMSGAETIQVPIGAPLPEFDLQCSLASLPYVFGTRAETIPDCVPYLRVDEQTSRHWKEMLDPVPVGMRVGVTWAGNPSNKNDHNRSMTFAQVSRLAHGIDACFCSLQKGSPAAQARPQPEMKWVDFTTDFKDFFDTAAFIVQLDLVITVDTVVAHLAGALGKPVWILLPFIPDWRWQLDRPDSPWYPTARLFRQKTPGDWDGVIERVRAALAETISNR